MPSAQLQVVTRNGAVSDWLDVGGFRAAREILTISPFAVTTECGPKNARYKCDFGRSHWLVGESVGKKSFFSGSSIAVEHKMALPAKDDCPARSARYNYDEIWGSSGKDRSFVYLKNGWKVTGFNWWNQKSRGSTLSTPTGIQGGATSATVDVSWKLHGNYCDGPHKSVARYRIEIYAEGPKGVPHY